MWQLLALAHLDAGAEREREGGDEEEAGGQGQEQGAQSGTLGVGWKRGERRENCRISGYNSQGNKRAMALRTSVNKG